MNETIFVQELKSRLRDHWDCTMPEGCNASELQSTELITQFSLPKLYHAFMETCGVSAGRLFEGFSWSLPSRPARNKEFKICVEENQLEQLANCFVFLDYIGDFFWVFQDAGNDPPIYRYDHFAFVNVADSFSTFILGWEQL